MKVVALVLLVISYGAAVPLKQAKAVAVRGNIHGPGRIVGGQEANAGQFPSTASIIYRTADGNYFCAGTLIDQQWIITAGQCVQNAVRFDIHLGATDRTGTGGVALSALEYVLHPEFSDSPIINDLGLIRLTLPVTLTDYIKPISGLATEDVPDGYQTVAIGWGITSDNDENFASTLRWVYVVTLPNEECKLTYGDQITDEKVCVAGNNNEGTCAGDSGGPLIHYPYSYIQTLVGVASFISQNGCENPDPSGFTRIYPFVDWIQETVANTTRF